LHPLLAALLPVYPVRRTLAVVAVTYCSQDSNHKSSSSSSGGGGGSRELCTTRFLYNNVFIPAKLPHAAPPAAQCNIDRDGPKRMFVKMAYVYIRM
jgi:hypothetical protein